MTDAWREAPYGRLLADCLKQLCECIARPIQKLEALCLRYLQALVLPSPPIVRLLRDSWFPQDLRYLFTLGRPHFRLPQLVDDLLGCVPLLTYV